MIRMIRLFGMEFQLNSTLIFVVSVFLIALLLGVLITLIVLYAMDKKKYEKELEEDSLEEDEKTEEIEVPKEDEESYHAGKLTYNMSFEARYIRLEEESKRRYVVLKNELKSYKKVKDNLSWRRESYHIGRKVVARMSIRGKTLCLYLPLDAKEYEESKYKVEDISKISYYEDTPCLYRISNERRLTYAIELIGEVMKRMGVEKGPTLDEDYYLPYEGIVELIEKGLIKRVIRKEE